MLLELKPLPTKNQINKYSFNTDLNLKFNINYSYCGYEEGNIEHASMNTSKKFGFSFSGF